MSKTKHLDTAIELFTSDKGKRAKRKADYTLTIMGNEGVLQGLRGKTVATYTGTPDEIEAAARRYVGHRTMEIFK